MLHATPRLVSFTNLDGQLKSRFRSRYELNMTIQINKFQHMWDLHSNLCVRWHTKWGPLYVCVSDLYDRKKNLPHIITQSSTILICTYTDSLITEVVVSKLHNVS